MPSVLFVCSANRCRSPMAEGLLKDLLKQQGLEESAFWRVESAGVWAFKGEPALDEVKFVMTRRGIDLSTHRSRPVTSDLLEQFNLILVMEQEQKKLLQADFPEATGRIFLLSEMVGEQKDVEDPTGGTLPAYRDTQVEIEKTLRQGYAEIQRLADRPG